MVEANEHAGAGGGGLVAAHQLLACLYKRKGPGRVDAQSLQHFGRQRLAHASLESEPSIAPAGPWRLPAPLRAQIEQPALIVAHLCKQKAAPVPQLRIIGAELMPMIAQGQRLRMIAGQGGEPAKMGEPFGRTQVPKPQTLRPILIAKSQNAGGEVSRSHKIIKRSPQLKVTRVRGVGCGERHEADIQKGIGARSEDATCEPPEPTEALWPRTRGFSTKRRKV